MISHDEVIDVSKTMRKYGGSFVACLGEALLHTDPINTEKIKSTWPDIWAQYKKIGALIDETRRD